MRKTGVARLPLHYGKAPRWLVHRMQKLAEEIVTIIIDEYGADDFLKKISDPFWFQALGCVLGYDWHSSGVTTVVTGVLKQAVIPEKHGIAVCGGKGRTSRRTPLEIESVGERFGFSPEKIQSLQYASKISAKVDNAAIQAGYQLYHHAFFVAENEKWAVIQQGMCLQDRTARRYHWLSDNAKNFVVEPHDAIVGDVKRDIALNMTARESEACRKTSVDIVREPPKKTVRMILSVRPAYQKSLQEWIPNTANTTWKEYPIDVLSMPRNINWKALREVYEFQPRNYEELLGFKGIGPATIRGLALISELIYGEKPCWKDPVKYSWAYGGKDGVPYPVNRKAMDESIQTLKQVIREAKIGCKEKMRSLQRLRQLVPANMT
ncbi:DUF763 domain-containing protein [Candidatus Bathyarchaeota archaeon]|nr:MAG: DUF763 domain-containing protein [Candidatus Bathyarchaeota archaeon]